MLTDEQKSLLRQVKDGMGYVDFLRHMDADGLWRQGYVQNMRDGQYGVWLTEKGEEVLG